MGKSQLPFYPLRPQKRKTIKERNEKRQSQSEKKKTETENEIGKAETGICLHEVIEKEENEMKKRIEQRNQKYKLL